jgi:hypothetical protein
MDIPASVLAQLGLKVQHALRAFTAADRKMIKQTAENYPETKFYKTEDLITQLGIGEALVTLLDEKGIPTPLVHTLLCPPRSRMDILSPAEIDSLLQKSSLVNKYNQAVDSKSAYEMLTEKLEVAAEQSASTQKESSTGKAKKEETIFDNPIVKQAGRTAATIITRSLLGALGVSSSTRRRKKSTSWF